MAVEKIADSRPQETHPSPPLPQKEQALKTLKKELGTNTVVETIGIRSPQTRAYDFIKGQIMANADKGSRKNPNIHDGQQYLVVGVYPHGLTFIAATFANEEAADSHTEKVNAIERSLREIRNKERLSKAELLQEEAEIKKDSPEHYSINLEGIKDRLSQSEVYKLASELFPKLVESLSTIDAFTLSIPLRKAVEFARNGRTYQAILLPASDIKGPSIFIRSCEEGKDIWKDSTEGAFVSVGKENPRNVNEQSFIAYRGPKAKEGSGPEINTANTDDNIRRFMEGIMTKSAQSEFAA